MNDPLSAKDGRTSTVNTTGRRMQIRIQSFQRTIGALLADMRRKRKKTQQDFSLPQRTIRRIEKGEMQRSTVMEYFCEMKPCARDAAKWIRAVLELLAPGCLRCDPDCGMCDKSMGELAHELRKNTGLEEFAMERAMLRGIIELNPYAIVIFDEDGRFVRANRAYLDIFKEPPPKFVTLFDSPPLRKAGVQEEFFKLREGRTVNIKPIWHNSRDVGEEWPDNPICIGTVAFPLHDQSGRIRNYVVISEDVTKRVIAEEKLREAMKFKSDFVAHASREIGMPLYGIISSASHMLQDDALPEPRKADLKEMLEKADGLMMKINGLMKTRPISADRS